MEDMGAPCRHPALGTVDDTQQARDGDQYAARHNPSCTSPASPGPPTAPSTTSTCRLPTDLASPSTTPALSHSTPNLCHDGHDTPCVDGQPGDLASADAWLTQWVPVVTNSPLFGKDGVLVITFDEADSPASDASACCGEGPGPNSPRPGSPVSAVDGWTLWCSRRSPRAAPGRPRRATTTACWPAGKTCSGCPTSGTPRPPA